jgi:hypothetical protein
VQFVRHAAAPFQGAIMEVDMIVREDQAARRPRPAGRPCPAQDLMSRPLKRRRAPFIISVTRHAIEEDLK